jgi:hypothetical protein
MNLKIRVSASMELLRPYEQNDDGPSEEDDQKNNELSDQFRIHINSFSFDYKTGCLFSEDSVLKI